MEKLFKITDLKANTSKDSDCIVIPNWIFDTIVSLCDMNIEHSGQLICKNKIVIYPFISASGNAGSVFPNKKVVFSDNVNYATIEFHTHTVVLGDYWNNKFSDGDLKTFNKRLIQEGQGYQHVLFTKENILTWGIGNNAPNVRIGFNNTDAVIDIFNENNAKYKCWKI